MTVALLALVLAVPALAFAAWPLLGRRRSDEAPPADTERPALETEKAAALRALRELDLERQAGHIGDEDYAESRARYEAQAAGILRRLDALGPAPRPAGRRPAATPPAIPWTRQPAVLGAAGAGFLVFGLALGFLIARHMAPAPPETAAAMAPPTMPGSAPGGMETPPGVEASAPAPEGAPSGSTAARPLPKELLQGMLRAAHASLDAGRYQEAIAAYKAILRRDPRNVEAITHLGVILATAGHRAEALEAFDRALAIDPGYAHALWDKAGVLEAQGDYAGVVATLERFAQVVGTGPDHDRAQARIRDARARLPAASTSATKP